MRLFLGGIWTSFNVFIESVNTVLVLLFMFWFLAMSRVGS